MDRRLFGWRCVYGIVVIAKLSNKKKQVIRKCSLFFLSSPSLMHLSICLFVFFSSVGDLEMQTGRKAMRAGLPFFS